MEKFKELDQSENEKIPGGLTWAGLAGFFIVAYLIDTAMNPESSINSFKKAMKKQAYQNISNFEEIDISNSKEINGGSEISDKVNEIFGKAVKVYQEVTAWFIFTNNDPLGYYWGK